MDLFVGGILVNAGRDETLDLAHRPSGHSGAWATGGWDERLHRHDLGYSVEQSSAPEPRSDRRHPVHGACCECWVEHEPAVKAPPAVAVDSRDITDHGISTGHVARGTVRAVVGRQNAVWGAAS